jgi:hypothetical protein
MSYCPRKWFNYPDRRCYRFWNGCICHCGNRMMFDIAGCKDWSEHWSVWLRPVDNGALDLQMGRNPQSRLLKYRRVSWTVNWSVADRCISAGNRYYRFGSRTERVWPGCPWGGRKVFNVGLMSAMHSRPGNPTLSLQRNACRIATRPLWHSSQQLDGIDFRRHWIYTLGTSQLAPGASELSDGAGQVWMIFRFGWRIGKLYDVWFLNHGKSFLDGVSASGWYQNQVGNQWNGNQLNGHCSAVMSANDDKVYHSVDDNTNVTSLPIRLQTSKTSEKRPWTKPIEKSLWEKF